MSSRLSASNKQRSGHRSSPTSIPRDEPLFDSSPGYPIQATVGRTRFSSCGRFTSCLLMGLSATLGLLTVFNTAFILCIIRQTYQHVTLPTWAPDFSRLKSVNSICEIVNPIPPNSNGIDARLKALEDRLGYQQLRGGDIDVAIFSSGARIIPQLTSTSYPKENLPVQKEEIPAPLWYRNLPLVSWVSGTAHEHTRATSTRGTASPMARSRIVLEDLLINGDCWQFNGNTGQVAIRFPNPVNITGMAVHYVNPRILVPAARKQAPRLITVWALQDGSNRSDIDLQINTSDNTIQTGDVHPEHMRSASSFLNPNTSQLLPETMSDSDIFLPIITAEYLLNNDHPVQTYPRPLHGKSLVQIVIVEVLSNWGADSTCLYHIGIHADFDISNSR